MKCSYDPREMTGKPIGMFHCPDCGEIVIAGTEHPDYSLIDEPEAVYEQPLNGDGRFLYEQDNATSNRLCFYCAHERGAHSNALPNRCMVCQCSAFDNVQQGRAARSRTREEG